MLLPEAVLLLMVWGFPAEGARTSKDGKEDWGYVPVRKDANMFWWLYYANNPIENFTSLPLVMWLQGGPGASSTGFGNFKEIGPLDTDLKPRSTTWVQSASVLFVDNPVGTGYSYTTNSNAFAKDLSMVVTDMMSLLKEFFKVKSEFQNIPFYIFSESYGGKMAAAISLELAKAVQLKQINCRFSGVALGDSWISPLDSVLSWGPYLYSISLLDSQGLADVNSYAKKVQAAIEAGNYQQATDLWSWTEDVIEQNTNGVNFYNIMTQQEQEELVTLQHTPAMRNHQLASLYQRHVAPMQRTSLQWLMNGPIRKKLKIIPDSVQWGGQSSAVFSNMEGDFMKPVVDVVDKLLLAGVNVTVYNGQLDLIVDTFGQEMWVNKLKWPGLSAFSSLRWKPMYGSLGDTAAFHKQYQNFAFYWVLKAGHMIPADQGWTALKLLQKVTDQM